MSPVDYKKWQCRMAMQLVCILYHIIKYRLLGLHFKIEINKGMKPSQEYLLTGWRLAAECLGSFYFIHTTTMWAAGQLPRTNHNKPHG